MTPCVTLQTNIDSVPLPFLSTTTQPAPNTISAPVTTSSGGSSHIKSLYNAKTTSEVLETYNSWAQEFNADVTSQNYIAPTYVAEAITKHYNGDIATAQVFDAGCGTGLSGVALAQAGMKVMDGCDLSPKMLEIASKTGLYRELSTADISEAVPQFHTDSYDILTCLGTLTHGHVKPSPAIQELVRITKPKGLIVATVIDDIWESHGYKAEVERLENEGKVEVLGTESKAYREKAGVNARIVVLRKR